MVSIEDQKIEFVDYTEPMCVKINFTTWERGDVIRKYNGYIVHDMPDCDYEVHVDQNESLLPDDI